MKLTRILLFSFMFAVCMIIGVVPVIPKRKEQFAAEMKIESTENREDNVSPVDGTAEAPIG